MDALTALRLQIEWGADEALEIAPVDRLRVLAPNPAASPAASPAQIPATSPGPGTQAAAVSPPAIRAEQAAAHATNLSELRDAVAAFDGCALRETASALVFAQGDPAHGLMLIGDAPGADDDRAGHPFAGPPGAYLERMLASIGLDRAHALLAPLIPWRPPGDRPPSPAELAACLPFLWRLIALARPRHIVLFGPLAARALLPATPRRRPRGVWVDLTVPGLPAPVPTRPSQSPAMLLRTPRLRRDAWGDLRKLRRALDEIFTKS